MLKIINKIQLFLFIAIILMILGNYLFFIIIKYFFCFYILNRKIINGTNNEVISKQESYNYIICCVKNY
jgi:hypothetical protein